MSYKQFVAIPISEGGTGQTTLANHSLLVGQTSTMGFIGVGATNTVLVGVSASNPNFSASPTVTSIITANATTSLTMIDNSVTAGGSDANVNINITPKGSGSVVVSHGGITVTGNSTINSSSTGTTSLGTGTNSGTISIGNTSSGAVTLDCGTAGITIGTTANAHSTTLGSTSSTSATTVQSGSGRRGSCYFFGINTRTLP